MEKNRGTRGIPRPAREKMNSIFRKSPKSECRLLGGQPRSWGRSTGSLAAFCTRRAGVSLAFTFRLRPAGAQRLHGPGQTQTCSPDLPPGTALPGVPRAQEVPPPPTPREPARWLRETCRPSTRASLTEGGAAVLHRQRAAAARLRDPHAVPRLRAPPPRSGHPARRRRAWDRRAGRGRWSGLGGRGREGGSGGRARGVWPAQGAELRPGRPSGKGDR